METTEEWMKKMWYYGYTTYPLIYNDILYIYNGYYSAIKKNKIMPFAATWVDIETVILSGVSQIKNDKNH